MKKTYMAPLTKVVTIKVETMLAGSDPAGYNRALGGMESAKSGSVALDKDDDFDSSGDLW